MIDPQIITLIATLLKTLAFIVLYVFIGFGPGFIVGLLLANHIYGKNHPVRMDIHNDNIEKAIEHNKQWHPDNPRWQ